MALAASLATTSARAQRLHFDLSVSGQFATGAGPGGAVLITLTLGPMFEVSSSFLIGLSAGGLIGFSEASSFDAVLVGLPFDVVARARFGPVYIDASIGPWFVAGLGGNVVVLHLGGTLGAQLGVFRIGVMASDVGGYFVIGPVLGLTF